MAFLRKLGILFKKFVKMESTCPEMCSVSVPLQETIGLCGGLISRLLVTWCDLLIFMSVFYQMRMLIFGGDEMFKYM